MISLLELYQLKELTPDELAQKRLARQNRLNLQPPAHDKTTCKVCGTTYNRSQFLNLPQPPLGSGPSQGHGMIFRNCPKDDATMVLAQ